MIMESQPVFGVVLLWMAFAGTHVGLATRRVRAALVARLGEGGFTTLFSIVAALGYAALVAYYAAHRFAGAPGLALGRVPVLREVLIVSIVTGVVLMVAGLAAYPGMPSALFDQPIGAPRGIECVTRHPFFVGVTLAAVAHALLATRLVGAVFALGFALLAIAGAWHQDRKLEARRGAAYSRYLAVTSVLPFAALVAGRQRLAWREVPFGALGAGLAAAIALRLVHDRIFAHGGVWVVVAVVGGGALATWQASRRAQRVTARRAPATARAHSG
jgi:uncharacterized membrane protein